MISASQIRGARAILGWSVETLAKQAAVGTATVVRIEHSGEDLHGRYRTVEKITRALSAGGVRFTEGAHGEPGLELVQTPES